MKKKMLWKRLVWILLVGFGMALCLECLLAILSAMSGVCDENRKMLLTETQAQDYVLEGTSHIPVSADPWIIFQGENNIGSLELFFSEPMEADTWLYVHYVPEPGDGFDRFRMKTSYLMKGTTRAVLQLPPGAYKNLRVSIRGSFILDKVQGYQAVSLKDLAMGDILLRFHVVRFCCIAFFFTGGCYLACRKKDVDCVNRKDKAEKETGGGHRERIAWMDGVRVLAAVFVVAVHVLEPLTISFGQGTVMRTAGDAAVLLFLSCNLLFFFLSGALLLPYREESWEKFIKKRFLKVFLPFCIVALFYTKISCASVVTPGQWVLGNLRMLWTGEILAGGHLWLIYQLLGAYLAVIPLRYMLRAMGESGEKQLCIVILALLGIRTMGTLTGYALGVPVFLDGWIGIFLMGYFLARDWMRKYDKAWICGGILAWLTAIWLGTVRADYKLIVCNCSIIMLFIAGGVFVSILGMEKWLRRIRSFLSFFSRYSYTVLLIHYYVLYGIIYNGIFYSAMNRMTLVGGLFFLCISMSFLLAFLLEHTVIAVIYAGIQRCS